MAQKPVHWSALIEYDIMWGARIVGAPNLTRDLKNK